MQQKSTTLAFLGVNEIEDEVNKSIEGHANDKFFIHDF